MKQTIEIYSCDHCEKELSKRIVANKSLMGTHYIKTHIHLSGNIQGIQGDDDGNLVCFDLKKGDVMHFCNSKCLGDYVDSRFKALSLVKG